MATIVSMAGDDERALGARVRANRRARTLTQQEVADLANVSVGAVKNLESGKGAHLSTFVRVLRALDLGEWLGTLPDPVAPFNPLDLPGPVAGRRRGRVGEQQR